MSTKKEKGGGEEILLGEGEVFWEALKEAA